MRGESRNDFMACLDSHITNSAIARLLSCFRDWWENSQTPRSGEFAACLAQVSL